MSGCVENGSWRARSRMSWRFVTSWELEEAGEEGAEGHWVDVDDADEDDCDGDGGGGGGSDIECCWCRCWFWATLLFTTLLLSAGLSLSLLLSLMALSYDDGSVRACGGVDGLSVCTYGLDK